MPSPYACMPALSQGRLYPEPDASARGPRTAFQRDRDRIIHSISFRRLRHKTQVFVAPDGDHFRVRLTHSLEVAQIGRTIARALGLDEDLTEALCLAHDLGHPPFGHAGEAALQEALACFGGFDHNGHTLRIVSELEMPYPRWNGLNLSWETLEGLAKHNGPVCAPGWALAGVDVTFPLELAGHASLEAQVAAIADDIAYDNHDIDDGLRAGLISFDDLMTVPLIEHGWKQVRDRFADVAPERLRGELIRHQIGTMVNDVLDTTRARLVESGVASPADVRSHGTTLAGFSKALASQEADLKSFMYARVYRHPHQLEMADLARTLITGLFSAYQASPGALPPFWRDTLPEDAKWRARRIADFIAGMTDRYAIARYREFVGSIDLPDGF